MVSQLKSESSGCWWLYVATPSICVQWAVSIKGNCNFWVMKKGVKLLHSLLSSQEDRCDVRGRAGCISSQTHSAQCLDHLGTKVILLHWAAYPCGLKSACMHAQSLQLCLTLCDPMDYSSPGSSVHGILQTRILDWVAVPSSRGSSQSRD